MSKNENYKVLVTFKISTLLKIFFVLALTIFIITLTKVNNKSSQIVAKEIKDENIDNNLDVASAEDNGLVETENGVTIQLSSRSLETERTSQAETITTEETIVSEENNQAMLAAENPVEEESIVETIEEIVEVPSEESASTPIEDVTISVDMDLNVRTGLSRDDFITLMTNLKADTSGFFEENAGKIYDVCEEYSINEIFFVGLMSAESGWNIAANHRRTYNYISLMGGSGLIQFSSVDDGIESAARILHERYLTPGGKCYNGSTLSGVKVRFCPASSTWVNLVYGRMSQII